jgi:hypothetical protein
LKSTNITKEFREHVESCSRPITGDSESTTSSLSPPPESHHGDDGDDESTDLDHLTAYVAGELTYYPEIKGDANEDVETADAPPRTHFGRLTDAQKFVDSLDDMEDLPLDVLTGRVRNATRALIQWQNEWMDLDRFIEDNEPAAQTVKPHKNPRIPKDTQIGIGYRDELESFIYGFEYQYHQTKVGKQNPLRQRYTNGANGGRELRQRVPTQKAVEADLSTSPDSDEGVGTRRRGRAQKLREATAEIVSAVGSRGQRGRNNSRIDSQSRDQTPTSTFPSGKKRGRPAKAKVGASRLQELQRKEGFEYDSTPEPSHNQHITNNTENPSSLTRRRSYGFHETLESTENWQEDTEQDEPASRPGTSDSTMTGPSDDMRNPPARSSGRGRKRQNTSDFEDALPSHKRIRKTNNPTTNGFGDLELAQSTKDVNNAEKTRNTRRTRHEDDILLGELAASEGTLADSQSRSQDSRDARAISGSKIDNSMQKNQNSKERKIITLKTSNGIPRTPANAALTKNAATDPLPGTSAQQDGKDGPKVSRASLNMMRRWAAKKQAEALGLPVPKIGRYPKGGSVSSTPDVAGVADSSNSPKPLGGRKRKRDEEEPNNSNIGVSDAVAATVEAPVIIKKRGGRPKKITNLEHPPNAESAEQHTIHGGGRSNTSISDKEDTKHEEAVVDVVPKKKGGRPRKKPIEVDTLVEGIQDRPQLLHQASLDIDGNLGKVEGTRAVISPQDVDSTNEDFGSVQPQLRRTTRVRRQTSAALSASSQRSGRSSQKSTVTPTPGPTQQLGEEAVIKQEAVTAPALPRKRGRRPKSAMVDTSPEATVNVTNVTEDEAPPTKRRRVGRTTKGVSTGSTPAVSDEERNSPQEDRQAVQKSGPRKRKVSVPDIPAPEVLSDSHGTLIEASLPRRLVKASTTDMPATDAPSVTPGSSVEPLAPKKKGGRPRKNANLGSRVTDVSVKAEDLTHPSESLTTRARSSGQDNALPVDQTEESHVGSQAVDQDPPKKKGNWGGKRVKGVFSSGIPPKPVIAPGSQAITGSAAAEEQAQPGRIDAHDSDVQERSKRGTQGGFRNKSALPLALALSDGTGADAADPTTPSNGPLRSKRAISKAATFAGEVGDHDAESDRLSFSPSRPKRAITIAEAPARASNFDDAPAGAAPRPKRALITSVAQRGEITTNDTLPGAPSNALSRSKRAAPVSGGLEDVGETGIDGSISPGSSRPKRVVTMKISPAGALAIDNAETSPNATLGKESIDPETNKKLEKQKDPWSGKRVKGIKVGGEDIDDKVESDNEDTDSDATRKEKKVLAAKASKAAKNSLSMKGMHPVTFFFGLY